MGLGEARLGSGWEGRGRADKLSVVSPLQMTIGVHSGEVVSGVIGQRTPRYCLFGNTVNLASRTQTTGRSGTINVSEDAYRWTAHTHTHTHHTYNTQYRIVLSFLVRRILFEVKFDYHIHTHAHTHTHTQQNPCVFACAQVSEQKFQ